MRARWVLIAGCLLFSTESVLAQGGAAAAADLVSGTWTGDMAPIGSANRQPITVTLKLEANALSGSVTGPPVPGVIRKGAYDPATGVLKFEVEVTQDGSTSVFAFEGTVVEGSALGRVRNGATSGTFRLAKGGASSGARQQGALGNAEIQGGFSQVNEWVTRAVALVPADKYAYRPASTVRTFGQLVAHLADSYKYYCAAAQQGGVQWSDAIEKGSTDKATVVKKLEEASAACATVYAAGGNPRPLVENIAHTNLHYGNIITYMRMLGLVPPSS